MTREKKFKKEFRREVGLAYLGLTAKTKIDDEELIKKCIAAVEKKVVNSTEVVNCSECGAEAVEEDTFCWNCGGDVSADGSGGFDTVKKSDKGDEQEKASEDDADEDENAAKEQTEQETEHESPPEEESDEEKIPLVERVKRIRSLTSESGTNAWDVGRELYVINTQRLYKEEKFKTFEDFCEKLLAMSYENVRAYLRVVTRFTREEAQALPIFKLLLLSKVKDDGLRHKLLEAAKPKDEGGKGLAETALKEKIQGAKTTAGEKPDSQGRPKISPFGKFVGMSLSGKFGKEKDRIVISEGVGPGVGIEIRFTKTGVNVEFISLEE